MIVEEAKNLSSRCLKNALYVCKRGVDNVAIKDLDGQMLTDGINIMELWKQHLQNLLVSGQTFEEEEEETKVRSLPINAIE